MSAERLTVTQRPAVLVFPATTTDAREFLALCRREGRPVQLAGSAAEPPPGLADARYTQLPSIHAREFPRAFAELVEREQIGAVYAPVASVHAGLTRLLAEAPLPLRLLNEPPIRRQARLLGEREALATALHPLACTLAEPATGLDELEFLSYLSTSMTIYGESGPTKLAALAGIAARAVSGEVVEIGCLLGRSTTALRLLARRFAIGPVISVDPWSREHALQTETPAVVQVDMLDQWDYPQLARAFHSQQWALGTAGFTHLQMPSAEGFDRYAAGGELRSEHFQPLRPSGQIALLHIDGNHDFAACQNDWQLWGSRLRAGAWLILDDYVWAHGDGPRRVGDALLQAQASRIGSSFVCDQALFVHFAEAPLPLATPT